MTTVSESVVRQFLASDGYPLRYRHWQSADRPVRGRIVALHGIQSHSGWYTWSSRRLCQAGYEVFFFDRRGSGLNREGRGDVRHHDRWINDVSQFLAEVRFQTRRDIPRLPLMLLGLSWGGKLAAVTAARRPGLADALILLYPGIRTRIRTTRLQHLRLNLAQRLELHRRQIPIPLDDPRLFTGQPEWQQFIAQDDLALKSVTVSFLLANRELDRLTDWAAPQLRCPILVMLAGGDQIIDNGATREYFGRTRSERFELIEYPEAQHTLEFEPDRERIVDDLLRWLANTGWTFLSGPTGSPGGQSLASTE